MGIQAMAQSKTSGQRGASETIEAAFLGRTSDADLLESVTPYGPTAAERDALLLEHLPTVRYIARRIHERLPQHVELDDLVSAGVVGLIDAFSKFDHTKKVQFKSYAQFRIRGRSSIRSARWTGARASCGAKAARWKKRSARRRSGWDAFPASRRSLPR